MIGSDKALIQDLEQEYKYLLDQKFQLMEEMDGLMAQRQSIIHITYQLGRITARMIHLDERIHSLYCLPTEFEQPVMRTTQAGKRIWYDVFEVPDWYVDLPQLYMLRKERSDAGMTRALVSQSL